MFCIGWGKVTHFVSWCWAYSLNNVVSAIERWLQKSNEDPQNVFLWMCFFCNNQYRIQEEAPKGSRGSCCNMVLGQKPGALVNTKMAGEWWFIHPKCGTIGFDPLPYAKIPPQPLFLFTHVSASVWPRFYGQGKAEGLLHTGCEYLPCIQSRAAFESH